MSGCYYNKKDGWVYLFLGSSSGFKAQGRLKANGQEINVPFAQPCVCDWNEDGKKDLVIGCKRGTKREDDGFADGDIYVYLNTGTNAAPAFGTPEILSNPKILGGKMNVVDFDKDGKKDLVSGDYNGKVWFAKNIGTNDKPAFQSALEAVKCASGSVSFSNLVRVHIVDWDADGDLDMLVGERLGGSAGKVWLYECPGGGSEIYPIKNKSTAYGMIFVRYIYNNGISLSIPYDGNYGISLFSLNGKMIENNSRYLSAGESDIIWDTRNMVKGMFVLQITQENRKLMETPLLLK